MKGKLGSYIRFLRELPGFLNKTMSLDEARRAIVERLAARRERFLALVKRAVYDNPSSPYLPLLKRAQCTFADMEAGVKSLGLEGFLRQLKDAGVWIGADEYKCVAPIRRGDLEIPIDADAFQNPAVSSGVEAVTGGTSGRSTRTRLDLDFQLERVSYCRLILEMLDAADAPFALWYPRLPAGTGIGNSIRYAKAGNPPEKWFCMLPDSRVKPGLESRLATDMIVWLSRFTRRPLAAPQPVGIAQVDTVVDWMIGHLKRERRCVLQTYVSQAVRVSQAAAARGLSLRGGQFIVGSEPLTVAKQQEIESAGASIYPRYHTTELGAVAVGCGHPGQTGEYHVASDSVAVIQDETDSTQPTPLYLTSLLASTPVVMINVELGDCAVAFARRCGCLWEEIGLTTHLRQVASIHRATGEGMTINGRDLVRVAEEVLPARYGGSSVDYQWVEDEDERSLTRLWLRIDPRVGPLDQDDVIRTVLAQLREAEGGALAAEMWRQAGTLKVLREPPEATSSGKLHPLRRKRADK